jgi:uncharacterized protein (TIGR03067 family)
MNQTQACLSFEQLQRLMECELAAADVADAEEHLSVCEQCRAQLDRAIGNADWWQEARESLNRGAGDPPVAGEEKSAHCDVLALLGPTDDPAMLGRIGTYEITGILGRGGMGVVFKGFDGALNRYVAIKMLAPHLAASGGARKRFAREAQAAAAVIHDNVMAIHSVSEWQGVPYLVMPYGRGVSLQRRLSDQGPLTVREILRIGMQTAEGLAAAHSQGLVHRDVKPANILLGQDVERVTLTDFGLARAVDDASLTRHGTLAGTPQYMSPEQARAKAVDARSDLFSLGSVLYAMCTGRSPFRADSSYGVLRLITDEEPTPIREINPEIPEWLCAIVSRLMAKRPEDRFSSAGEVAELLQGCLAHVQQPTDAALPSSLPKSKSVSFFGRNKQLFAGGIAMVSTLVVGLAAVLAWQGTAPPDIEGAWTGEDWGTVLLEAKQPGQYEGTFSGSGEDDPATDNRINPSVRVPDGGTVLIGAPQNALGNGKSGTLRLKWSRVERRFNGRWEQADEQSGKISLRLVDDEIRGAWTTGKSGSKAMGTARLADLSWKRVSTEKDAYLELIVDKELQYRFELNPAVASTWSGAGQKFRAKADPEWKPVSRADVSKLLKDGQTIVIHFRETVPYEWVQEIIDSASQRLNVTVKVVRKNSEVTVISNPKTATGDKKMPGMSSKSSPQAGSDPPRGKILLVESERELAWINLGTADSVKLGMRFDVLATAANSAKGRAHVLKGGVEVTRILGQHMSEVRILKENSEDKLTAEDDVIGIDKAQASDNAKAEGKPQAAPKAGVPSGSSGSTIAEGKPQAGPMPGGTPTGKRESDDSLEGVWEQVLSPDEEAKIPEEQRFHMVFAGDWCATFQGSKRISASRFRVEPQHTPKRISDINLGSGAGLEFDELVPARGIYEIKDGRLRFNFVPDTEALPTKFGLEHPEHKRVNGTLAQEQLDALKLYSKKVTTTNAGGAEAAKPDRAKQDWCLELLENESNPKPLRAALTGLNQIGSEGQEPRFAKATLHALGRMYDKLHNQDHDDDLTGSKEESIMELVEQLTAALVKQPSDVVVEALLTVAQEKTRSLGSRFALLTIVGEVLEDGRRGDVEARFGHLRETVTKRANEFVKVLVDTRKERQDPEGPAFLSALHVVKISKRRIQDFEGLEPFITQQLARGSFQMGADHAFAEFLLDIDPNYPGLIDFMLRLLRNAERDFDHSDLTPMFPRFGENAKLFVPELVKMLQMRSKQAFEAGTSRQVFIQGGKAKQLAEALGTLGPIAKDALPLLREISATPLPTEGAFSETSKTKNQRQFEQSVTIVKNLKVAADNAIKQINEAPKPTTETSKARPAKPAL